MRRRYVAWIAVAAVAGVPATAGAAQSSATPTMHVSVTPRSGSAHTHFTVSFRAAATTGTSGVARRVYSITARGPSRGGCQSSATVQAPPSTAGSNVRVVLAPSRSSSWCGGTYHGTVWEIVTLNCGPPLDAGPRLRACPASLSPAIMIGKFTFSVTRG